MRLNENNSFLITSRVSEVSDISLFHELPFDGTTMNLFSIHKNRTEDYYFENVLSNNSSGIYEMGDYNSTEISKFWGKEEVCNENVIVYPTPYAGVAPRCEKYCFTRYWSFWVSSVGNQRSEPANC